MITKYLKPQKALNIVIAITIFVSAEVEDAALHVCPSAHLNNHRYRNKWTYALPVSPLAHLITYIYYYYYCENSDFLSSQSQINK